MIESFADKQTAMLWRGERSKLPLDIARRALMKLQLIHAAPSISFLRNPPSNRLEPLVGDRAGQHSIRINQQWRVCFYWDSSTNNARDVEIVDYH